MIRRVDAGIEFEIADVVARRRGGLARGDRGLAIERQVEQIADQMRGDVVADAHARFADRAPRRPHPVQRLPALRDVRCPASGRSEEHTSELQSLMRTSY